MFQVPFEIDTSRDTNFLEVDDKYYVCDTVTIVYDVVQ